MKQVSQNHQESVLADELKAALGKDCVETSTVGDCGILDLGRSKRRRIGEAIFAQGKTVDQLVRLAQSLSDSGQTVLATRMDTPQGEALCRLFPGGEWDPDARTFVMMAEQPTEDELRVASSGLAPVLVACAGTADMPVAQEAANCLRAWRIPVRTIQDIGVAGLQRLIKAVPELRAASVVVAVAGMEATLPTAIAGLVAAPVIGVPTSVGYGANLGGVAALLSMINSCAGGLTVVNIDNGFGGAMGAALIMHQMAVAVQVGRQTPNSAETTG